MMAALLVFAVFLIAIMLSVPIGISMFLTRNVEKEDNARGGLW